MTKRRENINKTIINGAILLQERTKELTAVLERAREDINWMLNNRTFLNHFVFDYIDDVLANGAIAELEKMKVRKVK